MIRTAVSLFGALAGAALSSLNGALPASASSSPPSALAPVVRGLVDVNVSLPYQGARGSGTGMVLGSGGEVLTNNHVIRGATRVRVVDIANHRTYAATVVGYDVGADVAVLHLVGGRRLHRVPLGNSSSVRVGDVVTAIGNAGGVGGAPSTTSGKITARRRAIVATDELGGSEQLHGLLETSAPLQPGDSGGPLVSATGRVIGMDTAGSGGFSFSSSRTAGFAIPINQALRIAREIEARRRSVGIHVGPTAFIGVDVVQRSTSSNATPAKTLVVTGVIANTPAAGVGLLPGDVLTSFDQSPVTTSTALTNLLLELAPGTTVPLSWINPSGVPQSATITLASGPAQ